MSSGLYGVSINTNGISVVDHEHVGAGTHTNVGYGGVTVGYVNANNGTGGSCTLGYDGITISSSGDSASITATGTSICTSNDLEVGVDLYVAGVITWGQDNTTLGAWYDVVEGRFDSGWSGTISIDGNSLTFTNGLLTAASGPDVVAA